MRRGEDTERRNPGLERGEPQPEGGQRLGLVILPQAVRRMVPAWVNVAVEIVKGSALLSLLGIIELLLAMQNVVGVTFNPLPFYGLTAFLYFAVNFAISRIGGLLERRFAYLRY